MHKNLYYLTTLFFLLLSCKEKKDIVLNKSGNNNIVLIFKNAPNKKNVTSPSGYGFTTFFSDIGSYFDNFETHIINPKRSKIADTIIISPKRNTIELNLEDGKYDTYNYLLKKGDTISFNYDSLIPKATKKNISPYILNFDTFLEKKLKKRYSEKIKFKNPLVFVKWKDKKDKRSFKERKEEFKKESGKLMLKDLKKEDVLLDSLFKHKIISNQQYQYRKKMITFYKDHFLIEKSLFNNKQIDSILVDSDNYIHLKLYRELVIKLISVRYKLKSIRGNDEFYGKDSKQAFDSILISRSIGVKTKDFLLFEKLKLINRDYSNEDFNNYYSYFKLAVNDSYLVDLINKKYSLDFEELKKETKKVVLKDINNEKHYLDEIIIKNRGKLIYVDFWASWCAPCRQVIPDSKRLQRELINEEIVFLYLSIDKDIDKWKKAIKDEKLSSNKNSFLVINYPKADFFKNLKLNTIPRYIIFDKKGNLIHKNAPAPNNNQLNVFLEKNLHN